MQCPAFYDGLVWSWQTLYRNNWLKFHRIIRCKVTPIPPHTTTSQKCWKKKTVQGRHCFSPSFIIHSLLGLPSHLFVFLVWWAMTMFTLRPTRGKGGWLCLAIVPSHCAPLSLGKLICLCHCLFSKRINSNFQGRRCAPFQWELMIAWLVLIWGFELLSAG